MGDARGARPWGTGVTPARFAWCVLGMGLYWAWTFFSFNPPVTSAFPVALMHVTSMAGASLSFLFVALCWRRLEPLCARRGLLLTCGCLTALATPLYLLGAAPVWLACAGAAVSGAAIAVVVCAYAEAFARMSPGGLLGATSLVFMTAYVALMALAALAGVAGRTAAVVVSCALPLISGAALLAMPGRPAATTDGAHTHAATSAGSLRQDVRRLPWRTFSVIACMYFAIGGIRVYVEHLTGDLTMNMAGLSVGIALLSVGLVASLLAGRRSATPLGVFYKVAMPSVALAYVVLLTAGESHPGTLGFMAQMICLVVEWLCWVLIVDSARERRVSALLVIGLGRFVVQLGMSAGELAAIACADNVVPLGTATVFLLVLAFVFLFSEHETIVHAGPESASEAEGDRVGSAGPACDKPAVGGAVAGGGEVVPGGAARHPASWNLTEREEVVLELWVTSHGLRSIAETLGVSESTVKTHVRHIYEKGGVHSRSELIALLDGQRRAG